MRICIVAEGCYPYVVGGVSGWVNSMIKAFPEHEFVILSIISDRKGSGQFAYELPENVAQVYESYLCDSDWGKRPKEGVRTRLNSRNYRALRSIVMNEQPEWKTLFEMFDRNDFSIDDLLMGADFLHIVEEYYQKRYMQINFADFLWTMRSIYLPLFLIMKTPIPKADIYHCVATGYAGVLGGKAKYLYGTGLIVSEHGIYAREREEELIKATWVAGIYKDIWIDQFRKMSKLAYNQADVVTSLFAHAKELQIELGCPEEKINIIANGIDYKRFANIPQKGEDEKQYVNIGAIVRVAPIKDIKTMIRAYAFAKKICPKLRLWIMGPTEEEEQYAKECFDLVDAMQLEDVIFTGRVNVTEYMGRMDFTLLTSISEGQPLTIIEGFAAKKPCIATDVGNCRGLIYGEDGDDLGAAGIVTHIMNIEELANAMVEMANNPEKCLKMGEVGYRRMLNKYQLSQMQDTYSNIYINVNESRKKSKGGIAKLWQA